MADSTLYIRGKQLTTELTKVRIGGFELSPSQVSDRQITVALSGLSVNYLRAGLLVCGNGSIWRNSDEPGVAVA